MRERFATLVLALAALLLFLTLFVHAAGPSGDDSTPTSIDRRDNGLLGALTWLKEDGVRTLSLRQRFTSLPQLVKGLPERGNLLIVALPTAVPFRADEVDALDDWLSRGNTLLIVAALSDSPAWAVGRGRLENDLRLLTGLGLELASESRGKAPAAAKGAAPRAGKDGGDSASKVVLALRYLAKPLRGTLIPNRAQRYLEGVHALVGFSDFAPHPRQVAVPRDDFPLCLAHLEGRSECGLWEQLTTGAGSVIVSGFASLLTNRALGEGDNARFLANLVRANVAANGAVLFDDEHQGLSDTYDPDKFWRDRRLYETFGILAAVWLLWVVGGTRLTAPPAPQPAQGEADLVRTTGAFLARVLRPAAAARRMFEHFFARLRRTLREPTLDPAPYWDWLENNPRVRRADVAQLRAWYADAYSDQRVPLERLHNLIVQTEKQIAA